MSNELAIAAVTITLRNLINQGIRDELGSGIVTTRPPDKARENGEERNQINLFLYQTQVNPNWRNRDLPTQVRPGETGRSALPLNLYYLITAYGKDSDDIEGHKLLGGTMRILHDNSTLSRAAIRIALEESDLHNQIERVRINPINMSLEEVSKLWATFQTQYRISAAYEVSVVLIDSTVPARTPVPVLVRGNEDRGIPVQSNLLSPYPTLKSIDLPNQQVSVQPGDRIFLSGYNLNSDSGQVRVLFKHFRLDAPLLLDGESQEQGSKIAVTVPDLPDPWLAGFYTITVELQQDNREQVSNTLSVSLAPRIDDITQIPPEDEEEDPLLQLTCQPEVQLSQQVFALLGSRALPLIRSADSPPERSNILTFSLKDVPSDDYWVRLRVDGVDSLLIERSTTPPQFDARWRISIA